MFEISNLCGICCNSLQEAVVLAHCGHRFCKVCLFSWEATGSKVCPDCHMKMKAADVVGVENKESTRLASSLGYGLSTYTVQLPKPPFPPPHADLVILYHSRDDVTSANYRVDIACDLACYADSLNCTRRFYYCENCETNFHRLNYQDAAEAARTGRQGGIATPLSSLMKNPFSRASLNLEAQEKQRAVVGLHEQLLGHALYCTESACVYRNCALMKKYIWPVLKPRRRHRSSGNLAETESSTFTYAVPTSSKIENQQATARELAERVAERAEQIENSAGLGKGCRLCIRAANGLAKHTEVCGVTSCSVPYCNNLKQLRAHNQRLQASL